jgi:cobalt-zinc-cadmium efflux system membrane fusion protein
VLRLDERHTAQITSLLEGQVVSLGAELGAAVRQGQLMAIIHAPALAQAKTVFLQAAARAELTAREYERARILLQQEAIDQKEAARRTADFEQARTEYGVAESNLHSFGLDQLQVDALLNRARQPAEGDRHDDLADPYLRLTSPIDGRVIARDVIAGQHVLPNLALFTVSDLSTLWAVLDAREPDLPFLAEGRVVRIRTADAVQSINGEPVVFVRIAPDRFAARPIETGERTGERRVITKGLDGFESVVVTGAFNLKAEFLKSSLAGG